MIRVLGLLCALALPAGAETLPALYAVTGVASGDALNIRATPDAGGRPIGTLPRDARGVEVVALSDGGRWGQINSGEGAGWVAMRYLARQPGPDWTALQGPMICAGTEPFWSARYTPGGFAFQEMDGATQRLQTRWVSATIGRAGSVGAGLSDGGFALLKGGACSDGMSELEMGITVDLFLGSGAGYTGCCRLAE